MSCKCKCKFDSKKCSPNLIWNNDIWNPATCNCENGRYAKTIIDNPVTVCDEIIETTNVTKM